MKYESFVPLYQQLFDGYKGQIIRQEFKPGSRIDSINRIMLKHKVSRETAKRVLSKLEQEGYIEKKAGKGSFVSYAMNLKKIWGVVVPFLSTNIEELIRHIYDEAHVRKRLLRYYLHHNDPSEEMKQISAMIREGYECIFVVPNADESQTARFYRNLHNGRTAMILLDQTMVGSFFNYVIQSYDLGVKRAFKYLLKHNPEGFLYVKDEDWRGSNQVNNLMEESFRTFIDSHCPEKSLKVLSGLHNIDRVFLKNWNVGGILCNRDVDAVRLTNRLVDWGIKVPGEVALVCYGNTELTKSGRLPLTAVDCKYEKMAKLAVEIVFRENYDLPTRQEILEPELVVRKT